ncbi:MAG TPA: VWA domain-containing protein [Methylophaga aminisulfidivorans]|uniref:vWA domain-containing protein n=1 Tax=Methylophaga TaxID=40222 RepID=UPI00175B061F|nr:MULTISPECIES: vWA domain-containing protein [Methylophaga]HIC45661.1 VWA domain-containing protein [Methylophaga sp.]HIM39059.1 VWA domain-containing protein [Methylophaga aminisulfidivorans]
MLDLLKIALPLVLLATMPARQSQAAETPSSDVRVVIDVSGSMKKNDPKNLRAPALRMLVGLMPDDANAGVWTFAKMVNMLVPWQKVDDDWRQKAIEKSSKIHSLGLYTNIELALQKATKTGIQNNPKQRQSLILLSDGFVDLQPGQKASEASRQRILNDIVPKLKAANLAVHTIALSDNADHELLKAISMETDGWYQQANTADDLQRIFLHMFEKATQPDTVPLADNQFKIDSSVNEMTVLAFRKPGSAETQLKSPDGKTLTELDQSEKIRWLHEDSFDLITIENPVTGEWRIDAQLDPDNRVMVVTDMKLQTSDLPNNVLKGEKFDFHATLTDHGKAITRKDFLELVDGSLKQNSEQGEKQLSMTLDPQKSQFNATLGEEFTAGRQDVIVTLKSATFERQRRQSINVIAAPYYVETERLPGDNRSHRIQVQVEPTLIKPDSLSIKALLREENGSEWPYDMQKTDTNNWQLTLTELTNEANYELSLQLRGETPEGRPVFLQAEPIKLKDELTAEKPAELFDEELTPILDPITGEDEANVDIMPLDDDLLLDDSDNSSDTSMSDNTKLLIGNAIIVCLLIAGVIWWRRQNAATMAVGDML